MEGGIGTVGSDVSIMLAIKISFKTYRDYDKLSELFEKIGLERALEREEGLIKSAKFEGGAYPRIKLNLVSGGERAIFVNVVSSTSFELYVPDNRILYSNIYNLLQDRKLKFDSKMVDFEEIDMPKENIELLRAF